MAETPRKQIARKSTRPREFVGDATAFRLRDLDLVTGVKIQDWWKLDHEWWVVVEVSADAEFVFLPVPALAFPRGEPAPGNPVSILMKDGVASVVPADGEGKITGLAAANRRTDNEEMVV